MRSLQNVTTRLADWISDKLPGAIKSIEEFSSKAKDEAVRLAELTPEMTTMNEWYAGKKEELQELIYPTEPGVLEKLENELTGVTAAIQQVSNKQARLITGIVLGKVTGAATVGGIAGLIGAFGISGTGTAISGLYGAAATSSTLYWIGSIVGLGAASGAAILVGTGLGTAIGAGYIGRKFLFGSKRKEVDFEDHEKAVLSACFTLISALQSEIESGREVKTEEMKVIAQQALVPLINGIDMYWSEQSLTRAGVADQKPFRAILAPINLLKLGKHKDQIGRIALGALA